MKVPDEIEQKQPRRNWKRFYSMAVDRRNFSKRARKVETATTKHAHEFIIKRIDSLKESRRHIIVWFVAVSLILVGIIAQIGATQYAFSSQAPAPGGTYAEGVVGTIGTLNPLYASTSAEVSATNLLFSSLYKYDKTGHLHADLAESTEVNKAGDVYTVKLRQDVKWHDGQKLTAHDVAYTINLIKNPEVRAQSTLQTNWSDVEVEVVDDYTVKFILPTAYAAFPHALTFSVVPEHILSRVAPAALRKSTFSSSPVGSGPFQMRLLQSVDAEQGLKIVHMTVNEKYYGEVPQIAQFEIYTYQTTEDLLAALKSREITAAASLTAKQAETLDETVYTVKSTPINSGVYGLFNNTHPILDDVKVRKALRAAINTDQIRQAVSPTLQSLDLPFLPGLVEGELPSTPEPSLDRAKKLLDKAGWKQKDGGVRQKKDQKLEFIITTTKNPQFERTAEAIADQLKPLGVKTEIRVIDSKSPSSNFIQDVLQARNYDILIYELSIGADPDVYAYWHSSQMGVRGYNFANYSDKVADGALASARDQLNVELRHAKYIDFAEQWIEDAPAIGLYRQELTYVHLSGAEAMSDEAVFVSRFDRYANIDHWTVNSQRVYKTN